MNYISKTDTEDNKVEIDARITSMWNKRQEMLVTADRDDKQVEADIRTDEATGEILPNAPIEYSIMESKEAEMRSQPTPVSYLPTKDTTHDDVKIYSEIVGDIKRKSDYSMKMMSARWDSMKYGHSIVFTGMEIKSQAINTPMDINEDGVVDGFNRKERYEMSIGVRNVPVRNFIFDAENLSEADDCAEIQRMTPLQYNRAYANNKVYDADEIEDTDQEVVVLHYWNKTEDIYQVRSGTVTKGFFERTNLTATLATPDNTEVFAAFNVIKDSFIPYINPDGSKDLPYSILYNSIDGKGEPKKLISIKHEANVSRQIAQNAIRKEGADILAISGIDDINSSEPLVSDSGIQLWDLGLDGKAQQLKFPGPSQGLIQYIDRLEKLDIPRYTGINLDELTNTAPNTALQARIREETKNKRLSNALFLYDLFIYDIEMKLYSRIKQFLGKPIKTFSDSTKTENYKITLNDVAVITKGGGKVRLKESKGDISEVEITDDIIGDFNIRIETRATQTITDIVEREQLIEGINAMSGILSQIGGDVNVFSNATGVEFKDIVPTLLGNKASAIMGLDQGKKTNKKIFNEMATSMPKPADLMPTGTTDQDLIQNNQL